MAIDDFESALLAVRAQGWMVISIATAMSLRR
jgi:hypothetical protein